MPRVIVLVLNWNNAPDTLTCLESLTHSDYPAQQVLVVDNGSTDDSLAQIQAAAPGQPILETGCNLGYAGGNNAGIEQALADGANYVLLLNNDTRVHPQLVSRLVKSAEADPSIGISGPLMLYSEPSDRIFAAGSRIDWWRGQVRHLGMGCDYAPETLPCLAYDVDFVTGGCLLVRRACLEVIGFLDASYFLNYEDVEWSLRAQHAGFRVICEPRALIWHAVSASLGQDSALNTYYSARNSLRFFARHSGGARRLLAPTLILLGLLRNMAAWSVWPRYRSPLYRRRRAALRMALRDAFLRRWGPMSADVAEVCRVS